MQIAVLTHKRAIFSSTWTMYEPYTLLLNKVNYMKYHIVFAFLSYNTILTVIDPPEILPNGKRKE